MSNLAIPQDIEFSREFFNSLFEVNDGERFKTCLQCATCSGACPYGSAIWPGGQSGRRARVDRICP